MNKAEELIDQALSHIDKNELSQAYGKVLSLKESLTPQPESELKRLYLWLMDENREKANTAFTSGELRNVAREIEYRLGKQSESELIEFLEKNNMQSLMGYYGHAKALIFNDPILKVLTKFREHQQTKTDETN